MRYIQNALIILLRARRQLPAFTAWPPSLHITDHIKDLEKIEPGQYGSVSTVCPIQLPKVVVAKSHSYGLRSSCG